jgi:hypothetical protein
VNFRLFYLSLALYNIEQVEQASYAIIGLAAVGSVGAAVYSNKK